MTTLAPSAAPPNAAKIWCDYANLYLEFPCPEGGIPCIVTLPLSENGLGKGLALLRGKTEVKGGYTQLSRDFTSPKPHPMKKEFTEQQREATKALLRKMGMV